MNLQRLIYLCHLKNELNRKRRRFYYIWAHLYAWNRQAVIGKKYKHKSFTVKSAWIGYKQAAKEMKMMTQEMRKLRTELGAHFVWNNGGLIDCVEFNDYTIDSKSFKEWHDAEVFEHTIL